MIRGENSDSIPFDLVNEILSRLPAKSIARFRCVSKQWGSMFLRPYFTDLFLTRSSARPRLLFAVKGDGEEWCFFTSPQPQNPYEESSSLVVTADCHMQFLGDDTCLEICGRASGLICFRRHTAISEEDKLPVICNPSTGQYVSLPLPSSRPFLGFDPIDKHFKLLSVSYDPHYDEGFQCEILSLGTGNYSWRKIHCALAHVPTCHLPQGICINGILYYLAEYIFSDKASERWYLLVCFDVRSEKFKLLYRDFVRDWYHAELINYKGKLGVIGERYDKYPGTLCLSVLKDVEKPEPEWLEYIYSFCENQFAECDVYHFWKNPVVGVTATGEIVFSMKEYEYTSKPFYVFFYNPERNTLQSVEIQGFGVFEQRSRMVRVFVEHVEDLKFIPMKTT